jgi:hypothetical protein
VSGERPGFTILQRMTTAQIEDAEAFDGLLLLEPRSEYDRCIVGVAERFHDRFVLYDRSCVLDVIAAGIPDSEEDKFEQAIEHFEFNVIGGWVGEHTPAFLETDDWG